MIREFNLLLILGLISINAFGADGKYEPPTQRSRLHRDYYSGKLGVDTRSQCYNDAEAIKKNPNRVGCIPITTEFECKGYVYLTDPSNRSFQFCKLGTGYINGADRSKLTELGFTSTAPVSDAYVATGYFDANGVFSDILPNNTTFIAKLNSEKNGFLTAELIQNRGTGNSWVRPVQFGFDNTYIRRQSASPNTRSASSSAVAAVTSPTLQLRTSLSSNTSAAAAFALTSAPPPPTPKPLVPKTVAAQVQTSASAAAAAAAAAPAESKVCAPGMPCYAESRGKIIQFFEDTQRAITNYMKQPLPKRKFSKGCHRFIDDKGEYGDLGNRLVSEFRKPEYSKFTEDSAYQVYGVKQMCPNFINLPTEMRERFWVILHASIAMKEKACGDFKGQGFTPVKPAGMFQLEAEKRRRVSRVNALRKTLEVSSGYGYCLPTDITSPLDNTLCAMDILYGHFIGQYGTAKILSSTPQDNYWEELNNGINGGIPKLMKVFEACQK